MDKEISHTRDNGHLLMNEKLLMKGGLWPYEENRAKKFFSRSFVGTYIFVSTLPQFYGLYKNFGIHMEKIIEHMALLMFMYGIFLKFVTSVMAENNLKKVYDSIAENWTDLKDSQERRILAGYSNNGVILTKGYLAYMLMAMVFYTVIPLTPLILSVIAPLNETRPSEFIFKGEFPMDDMLDHYIEIFVFDVLGCLSTIYVLVTVDGMYASCIEHCAGLFDIIKRRLKLCTNHADVHGEDDACKLIVEIVKLHVKTIAFTDLLEQSYSISYSILMGLNMLYCSLVSVLLLIKQNNLMELIRYGSVLGGLVMHLFYVSWPGQKLIDHSTGLFDDAYNNDWYRISQRSKDPLRFMRLRCLKPCQLTAGGIYVMNLENFASIIKTSGSYIMVFASFT